MSRLLVRPSHPLKGDLEIPGDKSLSHRAILFGSLAKGTTIVKKLLEGEDVQHTVAIMKELGVAITKKGGVWRVKGKGLRHLQSPTRILDCGNSGTTMRLLMGLLAGAGLPAILTGDASLNSRPMGRVADPLRASGVFIEEIRDQKGRWIHLLGGVFRGGNFSLPIASAQLKSALLLAGLLAGRPVQVTEPSRSRDHSEKMLKAFGVPLRVKGTRVSLIKPVSELKAQSLTIPGDFSSAAFFIVAALINPDPRTCLVLRHVGLNPTRTGALDVLKKMGGKIRIFNRRQVCGEPVGDLEVRASSLRAVSIKGNLIPRLIDEIPILCVAAACAKGKTVIRDAEELRVKESDRLKAMAVELRRFGVSVRETSDGLDITGKSDLKGATGRSYGDHRVAMSLAILGTVASGKTIIRDTDCIATSFPSFVPLARKSGFSLK